MSLEPPIPLKDFPEETKLIGLMLLSFGELEFFIAYCVGIILGDADTGFRTVFRNKSAEGKFDVADAIIRPFTKKHNLHKDYLDLFDAIRCCRKIRNQYAHSHWPPTEEKGKILFSDYDQIATNRESKLNLKNKEIDAELIQQQAEYFDYTSYLLSWFTSQLSKAAGGRKLVEVPKPQKLTKPNLHNRPSEQKPPSPD